MIHKASIIVETYDEYGFLIEKNKKPIVTMSDIDPKEFLENHTIFKIDWSKHL